MLCLSSFLRRGKDASRNEVSDSRRAIMQTIRECSAYVRVGIFSPENVEMFAEEELMGASRVSLAHLRLTIATLNFYLASDE